MSNTAADKQKISSLAEWKKAKTHTVTLISGAVIEMQIPDLPTLVKDNQIPNELIDVAIGITKGDTEITRDDIVKQAEFFNKIVSIAVVAPKITETEIAEGVIPFEDKELIVELATRQRDLDAVGHHISGLEKVKDWQKFRGLTHVYADVDGL